jgi:hypothetical protein
MEYDPCVHVCPQCGKCDKCCPGHGDGTTGPVTITEDNLGNITVGPEQR